MKIKDEKSAPSVSGSVPVWIDVDNKDLIPQAVASIRNQPLQQTDKHQQYLLHDGLLDVGILEQCWGDPGTCLNWRNFVGCEGNSIIMITRGASLGGNAMASFDPGFDGGAGEYLESCSRAKLNLGIVTYRKKNLLNYYKNFTRTLR